MLSENSENISLKASSTGFDQGNFRIIFNEKKSDSLL